MREKMERDGGKKRRERRRKIKYRQGTERQDERYISPFSSLEGGGNYAIDRLNALQLTCVSPTCSPTHSPAVITLPPALGIPSPALSTSSFSSYPILFPSFRVTCSREKRSYLEYAIRRGGEEERERIFTTIHHRRNRRDGKKSERIGCDRIEIESANFLRTRQLRLRRCRYNFLRYLNLSSFLSM